jgi:RNA polymerase sigma factor (sigma-70 family)
MQPQGDAELVLLARSGNKEAFGVLIERYQPMARRIAFGILAQEDWVLEVIQEAFLAAYLSLDQLREPTHFKTWLYSIVLNAARTFLKERKLNPLSLEHLMGGMHGELPLFSDAIVDPQEVAEEQELHHVLLSAVQALSQRERVATLLFYYEQLSLQEIAAILGISVTAVKSRLFKARNHLRRHLLPTAEKGQPIRERTERKCAMIKVTLAAVRKNFLTDRRVVLLRDDVGHRFLAIWIGQLEALQIALELTGVATPRPLTLHFMANVMKATGIQLEEVRIETLKDNIFYAIVKVRNGELVREIDVRPSDALGLAVQMECPLFVAEDLFERVGIVLPEGKSIDLFFAEQFLEREGITLPEGKTLQFNYDKEHQRAALLKEIEELQDKNRQKMTPTAEEREQAKQRYLAFLMGEDT